MATSPRAPAPTAPGRGWTLVRPLGARAITTTLATTSLPNEPVVVQSFHLDEGERIGDPVRDLRALSNLRHTNVARIKEVSESDGEVKVVSPYLDGETLAALRRGGPIPVGVELRIIVDVLAGLTALHGVKDAKLKPLGIVHGEVAPANVVIGIDGTPKVIQLCGIHASPGAHGADTLGYLAPEILLADDSFDQRVDIYSVGVMLWEALTGAALFPETNGSAIVTRHLSGRIRRASVPADAAWAEPLIDVAQKAIATDPGGRYATAGELAAEIKRIAKTNLASTMKVAALVKERGADAIAARRTTLGMSPLLGLPKSSIARPAPKLTPEPPKVMPVPSAVDAPPTTKPVVGEELPIESFIPIESEDLQEASVRAPVYVAPPEPSVHDRITSPSLLAAFPQEPEEAEELLDADFSDLSRESEPPAPIAVAVLPPEPPPRLTAKPEIIDEKSDEPKDSEPAAAKTPGLTPIPRAAFAPTPLPFQPSVTPFTAPIEHAPSTPPALGGDNGQRRRRAVVLVAVGASALMLIVGSFRACMRNKADDLATPAPTLTAPQPAAAAPTADPPAAVEPDPAPSAPSSEPSQPEPAASAEPPPAPEPTPSVAAAPAPAPTPEPKPATAGPSKPASPPSTATTPKPKSKTYDPLGI